MTHRLLRWAFIALTAGGLVATAAAFAASADAAIQDLSEVSAAEKIELRAPVDRDSLVRVAAARDPFRVSRSAASTAFDARSSATLTAPMPSQNARPPLVLAGILLGAEPAALIDGLPGAGGTRVLRERERLGDYVVRSIRPDRVVIAGPDTTWTLLLRSSFP